jgi:hypothetical protein
MALAVVATTTKTWPRVAAVLVAVLAAVAGASAGGGPWSVALPAVVVPLLAWYAAGHLPREREREKEKLVLGGANALPAGDSQERVLPFRPRAQAPEPTDTSQPAPLRRAG